MPPRFTECSVETPVDRARNGIGDKVTFVESPKVQGTLTTGTESAVDNKQEVFIHQTSTITTPISRERERKKSISERGGKRERQRQRQRDRDRQTDRQIERSAEGESLLAWKCEAFFPLPPPPTHLSFCFVKRLKSGSTD